MTIREFFRKLGSPILWGNFLAMAIVTAGLVSDYLHGATGYIDLFSHTVPSVMMNI